MSTLSGRKRKFNNMIPSQKLIASFLAGLFLAALIILAGEWRRDHITRACIPDHKEGNVTYYKCHEEWR